MMSRRRRAPRRSLSPGACAGRAGTHTGQHGHRISVCRLGMEDLQRLGCFSSCSCCSRRAVRAVRRGDRAARGWRRAELSGSGVLGMLKNLLLPLKTLAKKLGGEALATARGVVHSGSPARCVHAGSACFLVCAASRRHARASLTLAACGSQRSHSSLVLDETPAMPADALRTTARSLACSALCALSPRILDVCARRISSAPQGAAHPLFPAPPALPGACTTAQLDTLEMMVLTATRARAAAASARTPARTWRGRCR
jgi:hypothetical protein